MANKIVKAFIVVLLVLSLSMPAIAGQENGVSEMGAENVVESLVLVIGLDKYFVNQEPRQMDAKPFIEQGRTFVPVRYLGYGLGVNEEDIGWEGKASKATLRKGDIEVALTIGSQVIIVNGSPETIDVSPILREGRTFLPARFVAEALGYQVDWDGDKNIVLVYGKGYEQPNIDKVLDYLDGKEQTLEPIPVTDPSIGEVFIEGEVLEVDHNNYVLEIELHYGPDTPEDIDTTITIERNAIIRQLENDKETALSVSDLEKGMIVGIVLNPDGKARAIINHVF